MLTTWVATSTTTSQRACRQLQVGQRTVIMDACQQRIRGRRPGTSPATALATLALQGAYSGANEPSARTRQLPDDTPADIGERHPWLYPQHAELALVPMLSSTAVRRACAASSTHHRPARARRAASCLSRGSAAGAGLGLHPIGTPSPVAAPEARPRSAWHGGTRVKRGPDRWPWAGTCSTIDPHGLTTTNRTGARNGAGSGIQHHPPVDTMPSPRPCGSNHRSFTHARTDLAAPRRSSSTGTIQR